MAHILFGRRAAAAPTSSWSQREAQGRGSGSCRGDRGLLEAQDEEYRNGILPRDVPKVVVEAGIRQGWERWVGSDAAFVTVDRFGASAPYQVLYEKYGLTAEHVVAQAQLLLS